MTAHGILKRAKGAQDRLKKAVGPLIGDACSASDAAEIMDREAAGRLLIETVACAVRGERIPARELSRSDWTALFRLAEEQKLVPLVADAVCDCPDPSGIRTVYERLARLQVQAQIRMDAEFLPIWERLRQAGVPALAVKGCLCRSVYPNGALRISGDEDLLVPEERFAEACRILKESGLQADPNGDPERDYEISWTGPDGLLRIELHRHLFPPDSEAFGPLQETFSEVFSTAQTYELDGGGRIESLSPHDHLLFLLLHAMKHFIRSGFGLRQLCDVGLWTVRWAAEIDWTLLWKQTEQVRARRFAAAIFAANERCFGLSLPLTACWRENMPDPEPMLQDLLEGGIYGSSTGSRAHSVRITQDAVAARQRGRRSSLRSALFPPARDLERDYPVLKQYPVLLPVIWPRRMLRYLKKSAASADDSPAEALRLGRRRLELLREYGILDK